MYSVDPQISTADQAGKADKAKGKALFQRELFISYCDVRSFDIVIEIGVLIISISLVFGYDKAKVKTRQRSHARLVLVLLEEFQCVLPGCCRVAALRLRRRLESCVSVTYRGPINYVLQIQSSLTPV